MAELKTKPTSDSVISFLESVSHKKRREDGLKLFEIFKKVTKMEPVLWGDSIIGFGNYHYKYASGREGDWFITGFSPRKQNLSLYLMAGCHNYEELLEKLGKHKRGSGCVYVNKLEDIDIAILEKLIKESVKNKQEK